MSDADGTHKKLADAFASFEQSLRETLEAEARGSVDEAVKRLSMTSGPFRVSDIQVDVTIRNLSLEATSGPAERKRSSGVRKPAAKPRPRNTTGTRGRPPGAVRASILNAFGDSGAELDTGALRAALADDGVKTSAGNLHQQLRRLVLGGELERSGRGLYRRHRG